MKQDNRWLIHRHLAEQTDARLQLVRSIPQHILLAGADADATRSLLAARYPKAAFSEYDPRRDFLQAAAERRKTGLLAKLAGKTVPQHCQNLAEPLPEAAADMLFANLSLITAPDPRPVLQNWARALKPDGLLFFTHFGADSQLGLDACLKTGGTGLQPLPLPDMHDLGDLLLQSGFYDPITDTSRLELAYTSPAAFWQDMATLGLLDLMRFDDEAAARAQIDAQITEGSFSITLETVFGHAVKKAAAPEGASVVQFYSRQK